MYRRILKGIRNPRPAFHHIVKEGSNRLLCKVGVLSFLNKQLIKEPYIHGPKSRIKIGKNSSMATTMNTRSGNITIGDDVMVGLHTCLLTGTHDYEKKGPKRHSAVTDAKRDIVIGDGVWICWNVTIVGPCEIGQNAVIAAGSVVTDDCEAEAIYAGNPAEKVADIDFK